MALYEYSAIDVDSASVSGTLVADTVRQARDTLRDRGLMITTIDAMGEGKIGRRKFGRRRGSQVEVVDFVRELATLLSAGIPLLSGLHTLIEQHRRPFKDIIQEIADQVAAGVSLADAMGRHCGWFDEFTTSIVAVGENTGSLDSALRRLADFKEKAHQLRSRVTTALLYPGVVCTVGLAVCIFLMTYVVPNLLGTLTQAGKELPVITKVVKAVSDFTIGWWWAMLAGIFAVVAGFAAVGRTEQGKRAIHSMLLRIPLVGDLIRKENTSRMAVVLASLLRSGLHFVEAIRITRRTLRNRVFQDALVDYEKAVAEGKDVAGALKQSGVFSPMVVQMLAVGQQAGELENMLDQLAVSYDQQISTATHRLTTVLEPLLIVLLAVVVGFVAFATILPILEAGNVL